MNNVSKLLIGAALLGSAGIANAATFTFLPGQGDILPAESVVYSFNDPADDGLVVGNDFVFLTGSSAQGALPAAGDQSRYLSVLGGGTANIAFGGSGANGFSLDIGSVDTYNTITLNFLGGGSQSFTGSQLVVNANGDQSNPNTNGRFRFFAEGNERIVGITLTSQQNSFEVDRLAIAAVPEPATWAMMIGGFAFVGAASRRRRTATVTFA